MKCPYCDEGQMNKIDHFFYNNYYQCNNNCEEKIMIIGEYDKEICATPELMNFLQEEYLKNKNNPNYINRYRNNG